MTRNLWFTYIDGREIAAVSPREVLASLQEGDASAPADLGRFLDMLAIRGQMAFGHVLDVGAAGDDLDLRCRTALVSLVQHGWLRVSRPESPWLPRDRRDQSAAASASMAFA